MKSNKIHLLLSLILGFLLSFLPFSWPEIIAKLVSTYYTNYLTFLGGPLIFFSLLYAFGQGQDFQSLKVLGLKILKYTVMTTGISALIAMGLFLICQSGLTRDLDFELLEMAGGSIGDWQEKAASFSFLEDSLQFIPDNIFKAFLDNNILAILTVSILIGIAILFVENKHQVVLRGLVEAIFSLILKLAQWAIAVLPFVLWSFIYLIMKDILSGRLEFKPLALYLLCVLLANFFQGFIVLPLLLKFKGHRPIHLAKSVMEALIFAFWSRSSSATLPITLSSIQKHENVSKNTATTALPLCSIVNMNACAAFIFLTVSFVASQEGISLGIGELFLLVGLSVLTAMGNAAVPMGCFLVASTLLAQMNIPLTLMGAILPFYTFLDMVETGLNVWSDCCLTVIVDKELKAESVP